MLLISRAGLDDKANMLGTQPDGGMRRGYDTVQGGANVLLYARYRGGSTFSSEFFNMHQDVWYLYEPLRHNSFNNREIYMDNATSVPILQKLFSCDLDPLFKLDLPERIQEFLSRHAFCHLPNQNQGCKGLKSKLPQNIATQNCMKHSTRVIKTIRIGHIEEIWSMMLQGLKVIQVVRDPRGVFMSRIKLKTKYNLELITYPGVLQIEARDLCTRAVDDVRFIRNAYLTHPNVIKNNYLLVRYEDLTANATQNLYQIYNFIGLEPDESVSTWAKHATDAVKHQSADLTNEEQERQSGDFGTIRDNPKETALAWRNKIPSDLLAAIDEECGDYYDIFNYPHNSGNGNYDEKLNMDDIIGR